MGTNHVEDISKSLRSLPKSAWFLSGATVGKTTVYVPGQVGWNAAQQITNPTDPGAQTRQAFENLEIAVRAAGGTRTDIVSLLSGLSRVRTELFQLLIVRTSQLRSWKNSNRAMLCSSLTQNLTAVVRN